MNACDSYRMKGLDILTVILFRKYSTRSDQQGFSERASRLPKRKEDSAIYTADPA